MPTVVSAFYVIKRLADALRRALLGCIAVALITAVSYRLNINFRVSGFLYLLVIVFQSLVGDFLSSLIVSVGAVICLDFFFVDPLYTFTVARTVDVIALASFLVTALVITQLVLRSGTEARSARRERQRLDRLYGLSQRLLMMSPESAAGVKFLENFLGVFGCTAICLFDAATAELHTVGSARGSLRDRTRDAYLAARDIDDPNSDISVRLVQLGGKFTGAIGFQHLEDPQVTSGHLAMLAATVLERQRVLLEASEAAAATRAELYRSAVLDALAHEFKTPLATILAAAGGLSEAGCLNGDQREMAEMVESEAARLGSLTSRLLRMARLDRDEVRPRMETIDLATVLTELAEQHARRFHDRDIRLSPHHRVEIQADPELFRLAISQLVENACKYSKPGSTVNIRIEEQAEKVTIRVSNTGSAISTRDKHRIFDRFYRGEEADHLAPGSGLGLYVARKIANAHGGRLDLEDGQERDVTFRFTIPCLRIEADDVVTTR